MGQMIPSDSIQPNFNFKECKRCSQESYYLNNFLICNSCCEEMKQMTPSGFKPNFKFEECKRCSQKSDYLNGFLICNPCFKEMKQMTPIGFKPNFKFKECKRCNQKSDYLINEFQTCNPCYKQQMKTFLSSGNNVIDNFIRYTLMKHERVGKMEFVPYSKFNDVEFVAEGGFSKVYKATWIDGPIKHWDNYYTRSGKMTVALKELNNSKNITFKDLNEVKRLFYIRFRL